SRKASCYNSPRGRFLASVLGGCHHLYALGSASRTHPRGKRKLSNNRVPWPTGWRSRQPIGFNPKRTAYRKSCNPFRPVRRPERGTRVEKGDRPLLPERPEGCFAQKVPVPFFNAISGVKHTPF